MEISAKDYPAYVQQRAKKSPLVKDTVMAFVIGGAICVLGQGILNLWGMTGISKAEASAATSCTLVFLSALLTGLNLYNKLGRYGGAGTLGRLRGLRTRWYRRRSISRVKGLLPAWRQKCLWWLVR